MLKFTKSWKKGFLAFAFKYDQLGDNKLTKLLVRISFIFQKYSVNLSALK